MLRHGLSMWWYRITKTPGSTQRALACIQYMPDPLRLPKYCRTRTDKVSWRINQWLSWCITVVQRLSIDISILSFRWGRDLADWRTAFRTVRLPYQSPGNWRSPLRLSAWTLNCVTIIPVRKVHSCVHIVKEGNRLRCYIMQ